MPQIQNLLLLLPLSPFQAKNSWPQLCIFNSSNPAGYYGTSPILICPNTTAVQLTKQEQSWRARSDTSHTDRQEQFNISVMVVCCYFSFKNYGYLKKNSHLLHEPENLFLPGFKSEKSEAGFPFLCMWKGGEIKQEERGIFILSTKEKKRGQVWNSVCQHLDLSFQKDSCKRENHCLQQHEAYLEASHLGCTLGVLGDSGTSSV